MPFSLRRWRASHLLLAWGAYWVALSALALSPLVAALLPLMSAPEGTSTAGVTFGDGLVTVALTGPAGGHTASMGVLPMLLWIVGPPLALWVLWLATRSRADAILESGTAPLPLGRSSDAAGFHAPPRQHAERVRADDRHRH